MNKGVVILVIITGMMILSALGLSEVIGNEKKDLVFGDTNNNVFNNHNSTKVGSRSLADSPWPMFRGDMMHTGRSSYNTSNNPGKLKWKFQAGGEIFSSPTLGPNGNIYFCSYDYHLYSVYPQFY